MYIVQNVFVHLAFEIISLTRKLIRQQTYLHISIMQKKTELKYLNL